VLFLYVLCCVVLCCVVLCCVVLCCVVLCCVVLCCVVLCCVQLAHVGRWQFVFLLVCYSHIASQYRPYYTEFTKNATKLSYNLRHLSLSISPPPYVPFLGCPFTFNTSAKLQDNIKVDFRKWYMRNINECNVRYAITRKYDSHYNWQRRSWV
jgi:hypothetical protein